MVLMLPLDTFSMLVCHGDLAVREEGDLYHVILEYIDRYEDQALDEATRLPTPCSLVLVFPHSLCVSHR
jgi:hypothetical protein